MSFNPFLNNKFSKLEDFADDNFNFFENGGKFFDSVENAVEKGEIACYELYLLFPQRFRKTCTETRKNKSLFRRRELR